MAGERFELRDLDGAAEALAAESEVGTAHEPAQPPREVPTPAYSVEGEPVRLSLPRVQAIGSWPQHGQNARNLSPHAQLRDGALTRVWATPFGVGNGTKRRLFAAPVTDGARVFVVDAEMRVSAIAASNGAVLWQRNLTPQGEQIGEAIGGGLAVADGRLYVVTGYGELQVLDAASGAPIWFQRFPAAASSPPMVDGSLIYVVTRDGLASALDRDTGRILWQTEGSSVQAAVLGAGGPAVAGTAAIFPFGEGELSAVLKQGGVSLWASSVSGRRTGRAYSSFNGVPGGPVVSGDTVYVATAAGRIAALDAASGGRLWTALEGGMGPVVVAGGALFVVSDEARLLRLNARDGSLVWAATLPLYEDEKIRRRATVFVHHGPVLAGGRLILASSDGLLREVDPASGQLRRVTALEAPAALDPIVAGGTLYVVTADGVLHAYR